MFLLEHLPIMLGLSWGQAIKDETISITHISYYMHYFKLQFVVHVYALLRYFVILFYVQAGQRLNLILTRLMVLLN